jgi:hypothetical protein
MVVVVVVATAAAGSRLTALPHETSCPAPVRRVRKEPRRRESGRGGTFQDRQIAGSRCSEFNFGNFPEILLHSPLSGYIFIPEDSVF